MRRAVALGVPPYLAHPGDMSSFWNRKTGEDDVDPAPAAMNAAGVSATATTAAPVKQAFGVAQANTLMSTLAIGDDAELIVRVIRQTLESVGVQVGELVADVIVANGEPVWIGVHRHDATRPPHAGGTFGEQTRSSKLHEAIAWAGLPDAKRALAIGLGFARAGVDDAGKLDERIVRFRHRRLAAGENRFADCGVTQLGAAHHFGRSRLR